MKEHIIPIRNTFAEDNLCEKMVDNDCDKCNCGCKDENWHYSINVYDDFIVISHKRKINDVVSWDNSERIMFEDIFKMLNKEGK